MNELRHALRALRATPVVTAVVIVSLALGIGANTAIFSLVDSLLLRQLAVERPAQLVSLEPWDRVTVWSYPAWKEIHARRHALFADALAFRTTRFNLSPRGQTDYVDALMASGNYFDVLGVSPLLGRTFTDEDDRNGGGQHGPVAVLSYDFWQQRFGGATDVIGRTLLVERVPFTVVGVMPRGFFGAEVGRTFDVAVPIAADRLISGKNTALDRYGSSWLRVVARLKDGQAPAAAEQAFRGVQPQIREATRDPQTPAAFRDAYLAQPFQVTPAAAGTSLMRSTYRQPVLVAMTVVALVLLIACANITNLFLARAAARQHELSVRLALGASRWRLARQLLVEILLLSGAGALAGLWIAHWGSRLLVRQLSTQSSTVFLHVQIDWRLLAFTTVVTVAAALLVGLAPALRAARADPIAAIRERGRGVTVDRRFGLASALVIGQVSLSVVLVFGAGLFVRTFTSLKTLDTGFDRDPVLVVGLDARGSAVEPAHRAVHFGRVLDAVRGVSGVAHAAISSITPVSGSVTDFGVQVEHGRPATDLMLMTPGRLPRDGAYINALTPDWFATYGTRLIDGRDFEARDRSGAPPVAVVNETFVRRLMPEGRPIGRRFRNAFSPPGRPNPWIEVVGVAADSTYWRLRDELPPTVYVPIAQWLDAPTREVPAMMRLSLRTATGAPALLTPRVADAIAGVDPAMGMTFMPLARQIDDTLVRERILAMLSGFFGVLALLLAGLGLYGLMSHSVSRRRHEIGIRIALGAEAGHVLRMVLGRVVLLVGVGIAAGALGALWASRYVEALLYGVVASDPTTLITAALVLALVGVAAGWIPARRASRLDPARVLNAE
jgi:putative ABC transport system permease protein